MNLPGDRMPETLARIQAERVIAVVRTATADQALTAVRAVVAGGIHLVEITRTIPGWEGVIAALRDDPALVVGAGTLLDAADAARALDAGARFLVAPHGERTVVDMGRARGVVVAIGGTTPTEVMAAWRAGADLVKVFPASAVGGPAYLRALLEVYPFVRLMPTGGVTTGNVADYLRAGAVAVGMGGELVDTSALARGEVSAITERAARICAALPPHPGRAA